ncbi:hypothetical protein C8J56DRAFT_911429 [Mycena floridula]|nr:hypothetical protein C8J56DRAFT_911429 [Mycena floridula]
MSVSTDTTSFHAAELDRALSEQSFGIRGYSILNTDPYSAVASVSLLEDKIISLVLTNRGYSLATKPPSIPARTFETVESLLESVSVQFSNKRRDELCRKLEELS